MQTERLVEMIQNSIMDTIAKESVEEIINSLKPQITEELKKEYGVLPQKKIEIKIGEETHEITGVTHEEFPTVLSLIEKDIPVYLSGPAGTGKNVICKQVADALGLEFYFTNAVTQEYKLTGFIDANGTYQKTQFYEAFTNGGVFFLDEMDASIPEVLVILNAAIANRYFNFPCGKITAHPDFRIIAAGNTLGKGANSNYTGRYCLDGASLDRFAILEIDYSPTIEKAICDNDKSLLKFCRLFRRAVKKAHIDCILSYRSIERIHKLSQDEDIGLSKVLKIALLKNITIDDMAIIGNEMKNEIDARNKYFKAFKNIYNPDGEF